MMDTTYMKNRELRIYMNKKRRARIVRRQRITLAFVIAGIIMLLFFLASTVVLEAHDEHIEHKYYTAVEIHPGDTLLGLSSDYISPSHYRDISSYINEVKNINHLDDNCTLTADKKIILPYYSYEDK